MRTGQVAAQLDISPSTLRRWTDRFADFLSESAASPERGASGRAAPREYTETDILVLGAVQAMREQGMEDDAIWAELQAERERAARSSRNGALVHVEHDDDMALMAPQAAAAALALALRQLSETQQALLNSQQAHRDLLGVVVQDNFTLKEENARLRKQLRQVEQDLSHMKESDWNQRLSLEERLTQLEQRKKSWWERLLGR